MAQRSIKGHKRSHSGTQEYTRAHRAILEHAEAHMDTQGNTRAIQGPQGQSLCVGARPLYGRCTERCECPRTLSSKRCFCGVCDTPRSSSRSANSVRSTRVSSCSSASRSCSRAVTASLWAAWRAERRVRGVACRGAREGPPHLLARGGLAEHGGKLRGDRAAACERRWRAGKAAARTSADKRRSSRARRRRSATSVSTATLAGQRKRGK